MDDEELDPIKLEVLKKTLPTREAREEYEGEIVRYLRGRQVGYDRIAEMFGRSRDEIKELNGVKPSAWHARSPRK